MDGVSASPSEKRIGIVTVSFRSGDAIRSLIASIPKATSRQTDIVVVDNVPGGDPALTAAVKGTAARTIARSDNPGYGGGVNSGVAALGSDIDFFLVVNPDVVLDPHALDELVRVIQSDPTIGATGPLLRDLAGVGYPSARAVPSLRVGIGHALLGDLVPSNPWTRKYHAAADYANQREAGWLSGACVVIRRAAFEAVGGFDDDFFMYFEDVDLGYRLGRGGWRNVFVPTATAQHEGGHSTRDHSAHMIVAHHDSARLWVRKRYAGANWWLVRTAVTMGLRLRQWVKTRDR
jgi:N-acetylglucosaminyl-diphospho-decaprenol L-rhamnosyltransferase